MSAAKTANLPRQLALLGLVAILLLGIVTLLHLPFAARIAVFVAAALSLSGLASLHWAIEKSDTTFFAVFGTGFLVRILVFALFAWRLYVAHPAAMLAGMLTLVFAYLGLLTAETALLVRSKPV